MQRAALDHCFSSFTEVTSGVPQGSVLGPIPFLIYINYMDSVCSGYSHMQMFTDDAKLHSSINIDVSSVPLTIL